MSHEITVNEVSADIELDYSEILENIEDTINERVSTQISDEAWDAVSYSVEEAAQEAAREVVDEGSAGSDQIGDVIWDLLTDYASIKARGATPCRIGEAFEKAVDVASREGVGNVDHALGVQKRLADLDQCTLRLERQMKTLLAAITDMGERAASVTPDSVV
jgi:hypothetical protein